MHCGARVCGSLRHRLVLELLEGRRVVQSGRNWFLARNKSCDRVLHHRFVLVGRRRRITSSDWLRAGFSRRCDGPIAIATPTGRLRGESSVPDTSSLGSSTCGASAADGGGRLAPRVLGGCRPRGAHFVGFLAGADGPWPCALRLCGLGHVRGRCAGPPRWGGSRIGGSVGLLWVHDAGPRGLNAASRSANQTSTPLGAIAAHRSRYSRPL